MCQRASRRGVRGFTLTELLVTMIIALVLMAGVYQFFIRQQRTYSTRDQINDMQQQAQTAQDFMVRALQQAGAYSPQTGQTISMRGEVVLAASDHYVTFQYDDPYRTSDPGVITSEEVVTFAVSSEKPSTAAASTEFVRDAAVAGQNTVKVYFDQNGSNGVEAGEHFALPIPLTLKGPPYALYRVTPDNQNPTLTSKLHAEPIASGVENVVLKYYDQNGAPIPRDQTSGAALPPPYALTPAQRAQVRSIQVNLTMRASSPDPTYQNPNVTVEAYTVATYNSAGAPQQTVNFNNDHYRRRTFSSIVTPRNFSANNCGSITLLADNAQPACPQSVTIRAIVQNKTGDPVNNATVKFTAEAGTLSAATATTNSGGEATTVLSYTGPARGISVSASAVVDCSPGGSTDFTVVNALAVNFEQGDAVEIRLFDVPAAATSIATCPTPAPFTFTARAYDACGNQVNPKTPIAFEAVALNGANSAPFGTLSPATFTATGQTFTVTPLAAVPALAPRDASNRFSLWVRVSGALPVWLSAAPPIKAYYSPDTASAAPYPFSVQIRPWPAASITFGAGAVTPRSGHGVLNTLTGTHTDCPTPAVSYGLRTFDCAGNEILESPWGSNKVVGTVAQDPNNSSIAAAQLGSVSWNAVAGQFVYNPPVCTLPEGVTLYPAISLQLQTTAGANVGAPLTGDAELTGCGTKNLSVVVTPVLNACQNTGTVSISGCNLANQNVDLDITKLSSSGGSGNLSFTATTTPVLGVDTRKTVTFTGSSPSTANAAIYLGDAAGDPTFEIKAYFPTLASYYWFAPAVSGASNQVHVSHTCQDFKIYPNTLSNPYLPASPIETCLTSVNTLYFKAVDCQSSGSRLYNSVRVFLYSDDGTYLDQEDVNLDCAAGAGATYTQDFRTLAATPPLPITYATTATANDHTLTYYPGRRMYLFAGYKDPLNPGLDNHWYTSPPLLATPASPALTLPSASTCQQAAILKPCCAMSIQTPLPSVVAGSAIHPTLTVGTTAPPGGSVATGQGHWEVTGAGTSNLAIDALTGAMTGLHQGTATVLVTDTTYACQASATVTVSCPGGISISSSPAGTTSIQTGTSLNLGVSGGSGTFTWSVSPASAFSITSTSGNVASVTGIAPVSNAIITATDAVTGCPAVYLLSVTCPAIAVGGFTSPLTVGATATATASGGHPPYSFSSSSASVTVNSSTGAMSAVSPVTNAIITATDAYGCTGSAYVTVQPNCTPLTISGNPSNLYVNVGTPGTLTSTGVSPWRWTSSAPAIATVTPAAPTTTSGAATLTALAMGTTGISVTDANGCTGSATATACTLAVTGTFSRILPGGRTLTATAGTYTGTLSWTVGNTNVITIVAPYLSNPALARVTAVAPGTTTITVTDSGTGCSKTYNFTVN